MDYRCAHECLEELSHPTSASRDLVISCVTTCRQRDANARPSQIGPDAAAGFIARLRKAGGCGVGRTSREHRLPELDADGGRLRVVLLYVARLRWTATALSMRPAAKELEWITNESRCTAEWGSSAQAEAWSGRRNHIVRVSRCRACTCDEAVG